MAFSGFTQVNLAILQVLIASLKIGDSMGFLVIFDGLHMPTYLNQRL